MARMSVYRKLARYLAAMGNSDKQVCPGLWATHLSFSFLTDRQADK
jgi:hypothetical protein